MQINQRRNVPKSFRDVCAGCGRAVSRYDGTSVVIWRDENNGNWIVSTPGVLYSRSPDRAPSYLFEYEGKELCLDCLETVERGYIESLPLEELPPLINTVWVTKVGTLTYKRCLGGTNPSK